jgi:hypothetical protein
MSDSEHRRDEPAGSEAIAVVGKTVRMSQDFWDALQAEADRTGETVAELVRQGALLRIAYGAALRSTLAGEDMQKLLAEMLPSLER